ncbi:MAG: SLATT domain-containing protein [Ilumatobacteraceae bacterium]
MSDRSEFLGAYDKHRVDHQETYYGRTAAEYERTERLIGLSNAVLLFLAGICGALGVVFREESRWFGLTAAVLSAIAAAAISWSDVIGFSANAELYRAAESSLRRLRPSQPDSTTTVAGDVAGYVDNVEEVLTGEVQTWGERWARDAIRIEGDADDG